ncbi:heparin lyase I family protein [Bradyrhizobium sp. 170]|uniref:heparin lyase I family protein n=1 Tax=Bradyrhizobium sp. 170 TaxID=2782641 RepID=UPI001FFF6317|nr:heparin lyase I family protein [Bradyrhizobium sp. 170]UPK02263.1 heparin lyase I family protein [Bradyrhizobium sp. 170]
MITSLSANAGIISDGLGNLPILLLPGMDGANSRVGESDVTPPLGSETVSDSGRWTPATSRLSGGAHWFNSADATSGGTRRASPPLGATVAPNINSFSGANGSIFTVDGYSAQAQNANQPWSLTQLNANTLQFSVRSGDRWSVGGYSDNGANRSEIQFSPLYAAGTQINLSETITIQPGPTNTASWLCLTQLHATTNVAPTYAPFSVGLDRSDHLVVILQHPNQSSDNLVYRSPIPIVRGQPMDLDFQVNMGPSGGGYVGVWLDGTQIVNYHGPVGATNSEYYWKVGVYRGSAAETLTADFSNVQITTGPQAVPMSGTSSSSSGTTTTSGGTTSSRTNAPSSGTSSGSTSSSGSTGDRLKR